MDNKRYSASLLDPSGPKQVEDCLPVEAILQITVNGTAYSTTVRTPGADEALVRGLLFTEGVVVQQGAPVMFRSISDPDTGITGCLDATVAEADLEKDVSGRRSAMGSASCGLCGIREPEELALTGNPLLTPPEKQISYATIARVMAALPEYQPLFDATGGVHGALAFAPDGTVLASHEDIGRHNAVDKVIGELILQDRLRAACGVVVSGRLSYEIVFKAFQARWPYLLAVSAPSSLAVDMGEAFGMCIVGFCRGNRATVYSRKNLVAPTVAT